MPKQIYWSNSKSCWIRIWKSRTCTLWSPMGWMASFWLVPFRDTMICRKKHVEMGPISNPYAQWPVTVSPQPSVRDGPLYFIIFSVSFGLVNGGTSLCLCGCLAIKRCAVWLHPSCWLLNHSSQSSILKLRANLPLEWWDNVSQRLLTSSNYRWDCQGSQRM